MDGALDNRITEHKHCEDEVVHCHVVVQIEQTKQLATGHAVHTVLTTGEWRLHVDEEDQLRQRESNHGEVDTLAPDCQQAEQQAKGSGCQGSGENAQFGP
ncbi:hypothetical protein D3C85_1497770 [compost metagenome]